VQKKVSFVELVKKRATAGLGDSGNGGFVTRTTANFASRLA
jgi:hypothetical protein